jgi:2-polyprenyl-6-methoxyphenol hydroxylase-like FAD-dependent oxidoreductase
MGTVNTKNNHWAICPTCQGRGNKSRRLRKKVKIQYQRELELFKKTSNAGTPPARPKGHIESCLNCKGSGLIPSATPTELNNETYPHVAIIGAGIGGIALAVACFHRGIPFTLYERDNNFEARSQGYGLTLQQASKAIAGLGIPLLKEGVVSTRHLVHTTDGKVIAEWGIRKWKPSKINPSPKRTNVHIARQSLRLALLEQLSGHEAVHWGYQLMDYKERKDGAVDLNFQVDGNMKSVHADLVVGADGIRSSVRHLLMGEDAPPLSYLGCIVILGICPLKDINDVDSTLLDSATVFQTANGNERIYMMPYSSDAIMWQLSFPLLESKAKELSSQGPQALKAEARRRCQWHDPIPQILAATLESQVSGYPVYDRALLKPALLEQASNVTLLGDAAHPMSPFKGQGANQALLDALALARGIKKSCNSLTDWKELGIRKSVLTEFESEMLERSATKVTDSAEAAQFLHSTTVLYEGDEPRGRCLKRQRKNTKK